MNGKLKIQQARRVAVVAGGKTNRNERGWYIFFLLPFPWINKCVIKQIRLVLVFIYVLFYPLNQFILQEFYPSINVAETQQKKICRDKLVLIKGNGALFFNCAKLYYRSTLKFEALKRYLRKWIRGKWVVLLVVMVM